MATTLGKLESQLLAYVQMRRQQTICYGELSGKLGISSKQERELLSRLARRRVIARARRGLYLVPLRLPPGGKWTPSEFLALTTLIEDRKGQYQICGPSAFYRYGWIDQVPNRLYAYNNRISGERQIGTADMTFIKVADERLGETDILRIPEGIDVIYCSRIRALIDAVYDWSRFNSLPAAYDWIRLELARDPKSAAELVRVALMYANVSTLRRLGKLLETEGLGQPLLQKLERAITPSSAFIPWAPTLSKRGSVDRRWGIIFNAKR